MSSVPLWVLRRLFYALVGFAGLAIVTYLELRASSHGLPDEALIALALVVALVGPGEIAFRTIGEWLSQLTVDQERKINEAAFAGVVGLADLMDVAIPEVGVTVFVVTKTRWHMKRGVQKRIVRVRLQAEPPPTEIVWTWKKGLLGACWEDGRRIATLDHPQHFRGYMDCDKAAWDAAPEEIKMNLKYDEYRQIRDFGFVLAAPMVHVDDGHYYGCYVVQVESWLQERLVEQESIAMVQACAQLACSCLK